MSGRGTRERAVSALIVAALAAAACGKKGPPLPPIVRLPDAPADLAAARRADLVELQFAVPAANTDRTRPADVERVDVFALTGPPATPEAEVVNRGDRVASIAVKAPRDPSATFDPDDPDQSEADVEAPQGEGLDQGAVARVRERLPAGAAPAEGEVRSYVAVGISTGGRRGPLSRRAAVPLGPAPSPPGRPEARYTETELTLTWPAAEADPAPAYHVYETSDGQEVRLTAKAPVEAPEYEDTRMTWGAERCYVVRAVAADGALAVESGPSEPACVTLADTFPPAAPSAPRAVATEGVINLIWDPAAEPDVEGYVLLRAAAGGELAPLTAAPIRETAYQDKVQPGVRYEYALRAVDRAGNLSPPSGRVEETGR